MLSKFDPLFAGETAHPAHLSFMIEATVLRGAMELELPTPRLDRYREMLEDANGREAAEVGFGRGSLEKKRAAAVLEVVESRAFSPFGSGPGFRVTAQRLALTENFVPVEEGAVEVEP